MMAEQPLPEKPGTKLDGKGKEPQKFLYVQLQQDRTGDGTSRVLVGGKGTNAPAHFIPLTAKLNSITMLGAGSRAARTQGGTSVVSVGARSGSLVGSVGSARGGISSGSVASPRVTTSVTTISAKPTPSPAIVRKSHSGVFVPAVRQTITVVSESGSGGNNSGSLPVTPTVTSPVLRPAVTSTTQHPPVILHTAKVQAASSVVPSAKNSPRLVPLPISQVRTGVPNKAVLSYSSLLQAGTGGGGGSSSGSNSIVKKDAHHSVSHQPPLLLQTASPSTMKSATALAKAGNATISIITGKGPKQVATATGSGGASVNMLSVNLAQTNKSNMINFKISNGQIQTDSIPQVDGTVLRETRPIVSSIKQEDRRDVAPSSMVVGSALAHAVGSGSVTVSVTGPPTPVKVTEPLITVPQSESVSSSVLDHNPLSSLRDITVITKKRVKEDILQRAVNSLGGMLDDDEHNGTEFNIVEEQEDLTTIQVQTQALDSESRRAEADGIDGDMGWNDGINTVLSKHHQPNAAKDTHKEIHNESPVEDGLQDNPFKTTSNFKDPAKPKASPEEDVKPDLIKFSDLLKWEDGFGKLNGSGLKFKMNEFNAVEIVEDRNLEELKNQQIKRADGSTRHHSRKPNYRDVIKDEDIFSDNSQDSENQGNKSSRESDDICCCKNCGCYGLSSEFFRDSSFCSVACGEEHDARELEWGKERLKQEKERQRRKRLRQGENDQGVEGQRSDGEIGGSSDDSKETDSIQSKFLHPWQDGKSNFSWVKYLEHCGRAKGLAKAAPLKIWSEPFPFGRNLFKPGMKLEAIDPLHQSMFCVMTVAEVIGYRLRLHFDGYSDQYDYWTQTDSVNIFPAGWCEKNGRQLEPPLGVLGFSWKAYIDHCKSQTAPRQAFSNKGNSTMIVPNNFRVGMKLEAEDRKNMWVCVATVADVLDNRVLIHFDGWDKVYDVWNEVSSPYIHPVGWCAENGIVLHPPNNYPNPDSFNWHEYLQETNSMAVPARAFKTRSAREFKKNMKVEVVDKRNPALIRVATIADVQDYLVKIHFDGWGDEYDYWLDDDCPDIHPPSWCSKTGHALQQPLTPEQQAEDVDSGMGCGTPGCKGVGHIKGPIYTTHHTAYGCPYSLQNINKDLESIIPDRLQYPPEKKKNKIINSRVKLDLRPITNNVKENEHEEIDTQKKRVRKRRKFFDELTPPEPVRYQKLPKISNDETKIGVSANHLQIPNSGVPMSSGVTPGKPLMGPNQTLNALPPPSPSPAQVSADSGVDMMVHQSVFNPGYNPNPVPPTPHSWERHRHLIVSLGDTKKSEVEGWNPEQVRDMVARIPGCDAIADVFVEQQIDGEALMMMTQNDLVTLLHIKLGPAIKIMAVILCLRNSA